jgi:hypothetical protein
MFSHVVLEKTKARWEKNKSLILFFCRNWKFFFVAETLVSRPTDAAGITLSDCSVVMFSLKTKKRKLKL